MIRRYVVCGVMLLVLAAFPSHAQVSVTVNLRNPVPAKLSTWESDPTIVMVVITNAGQNTYPDVRASYVIQDLNSNKVLAKSKDNDPSTPHFSIGPLQSLTRFGKDIVAANAVDVDPSWKTQFSTTGSLPEGTYQYCLTLIDKNGQPLAGSGQVCRQFTIVIPDPPTLVLPANKDTLSTLTYPLFQWTPVNLLAGGPAQYKLTIVPLYGSQTPTVALTQNTPLFTKTVPTPNYQYLPSDPAFTLISNDSGFAWQVQALDQSNQPATRNDGKSEAWAFYPASQSPSSKDTSADTTKAGNHGCGDPCVTAAPTDQTASSKTFNVNDSISVGLFRMAITKLTSSSGTSLTGEGTIAVPYLHAPIMVQFSGIQVNASSQMIKGDVTAKQDNSSPINATVANNMSSLGLKNADIDNVMKTAQQPSKLVSALLMSTPVGLPIGLDNNTDGFPMTIGIVGMDFTSTQATLKAVASYPLPDLGPTVGLGVGAANICFQPGGIDTKQGILYLAEDLGYTDTSSFGFMFKAPAMSDSGTYMMWDCKGFKELRLRADVLFPRDWLIPQPDNGKQAAASFRTTITTAGNWMAAMTMDTCVIAGSSGMKLLVTDMTYDHSDSANPPGIKFPSNYPKGTPGPDWHGFYIKSAMVTLPSQLKTFKSGAPKIVASNIIIDGAGFTGLIAATNVVQYPEGDFGDWGASIDTISVNFACSSLTEGKMKGRFQIPISDSALIYTALLSNPPKGSMKFSFTIVPSGPIKASLWAATLDLDSTSHIDLIDSAGKFSASALFSGDLSINGNVGGLPNMDIKAVKFQNVGLTSTSPYFQKGTWSFASPQHGMMGFPISISDINFVTGTRKSGMGFGLRFSIDANIADVISGGTSLSIWAVMATNPGEAQMFSFDGVDLDSIHVNADLGAVTIAGTIVVYHDDNTYGNGFRGELDANFLKAVEVKAVAQFGTVNGYRYWYVDASAIFSTGIPVFTGVAFYGFGGGAWYHMNVKPVSTIADNPSVGDSPGTTKSGFTFTPDQSIDLGLEASVTVGTHPSPLLFSADVTLQVQFVSNGIGSITLAGDGYMIATSFDKRNEANFRATASISYDFVNSIFEGNFHVWSQGNIAAVAKVDASINLHFDQANWHVLIGTPSQEISVQLFSVATVQAYIMAGTDIPAPDPNNFPHRAEVEQAIGHPLPTDHMPISEKTEGFALGASLGVSADLTFAIFKAHMAFGFGFDIAVVHQTNIVCSNMGNQPPGYDGWFGYGDLYAYVDFKISIHVDVWFTSGDFDILDMGAGALCRFTTPNPTWVQGTVGGHFSILNGLVEGDCEFVFELGSHCAQASDAFTVDIINDVQPKDGTGNYDVYGRPTVSLHFPVNQSFDLQYMQDDQQVTGTFRVIVDQYAVSSNGNPVSTSWDSPDGYTLFLLHDQHLPENSPLVMTFMIHAEQFDGSTWSIVHKKSDNSEVREAITVHFSTGPLPDHIVDEIVVQTVPHALQRNFLTGEEPTGRITTFESVSNLFPPSGATVKNSYVAKFIPIGNGDTMESTVSIDGSGRNITFPMPAITKGSEYALQIVRRFSSSMLVLSALTQTKTISAMSMNKGQQGYHQLPMTTSLASSTITVNARPKTAPTPGAEVSQNEHLLYLLYFRASQYGTLSEKINDFQTVRTDDSKYWDVYEAITPVFNVYEGFDDFDMYGYTMHEAEVDQQAAPLVRVDALKPTETWFTSYAKNNIYQHIIDLQVHGLWHFDPSLSDPAFALFNIGTPGPFVSFVGPSTGKLSPPAPPMPISRFSFGTKSFGLPFIASRREVKFKYLHPELIPVDYINLRFGVGRVMAEYQMGGADDDESEIYGKGDWIASSSGWMQNVLSGDLNAYDARYKPIYAGSYTLSFIYSPKMSFDGKGPWINRTFTVGNPKSLIIKTPNLGRMH
ncbi:MAG TPA: hypothetical protein VMG09_16760 [Bacteroidota bacterium]|nr:hypothetical protein [Bacteroidota bacterium]